MVDDDALPPFARGRPLTTVAIRFAAEHHRRDRRESDAAPFILHPLEVAALLVGRGFDDEVIAAGVLHDILEDTDVVRDELERRFGDRTAALVAAVSEDVSVADYTQRKAGLREQVAAAAPEAQAIYAADKLAKTRELRALVTRAHVSLSDARIRLRLEHYDESLRLLEAAIPELPLVAQLRFELWALRRLPPARSGLPLQR